MTAGTAGTATGTAGTRELGRLRGRGAVLMVGAVATGLFIAPVGGLGLYWMPLFVGLSYLTASLVGGRTGGLWVPGLMVTFWGLADVLVLSGTLRVDFPSAAIVGIGLGAVLSVLLLPRFGIPVTVLSLAVNTLLIGVLELAEAQLGGALVDGWAWGLLLVIGALWESRPSVTMPDRERVAAEGPR